MIFNNIDYDDFVELSEKILEYSDSTEFTTTLKMNYMIGKLIGNKII